LGKGSFDFGAQGWVQCKVAGFMAVYMSAVKFMTLKVSRKLYSVSGSVPYQGYKFSH